MPTISVFFGIVIKMFFDEHPPPHFMPSIKARRRYLISEETSFTETFDPGRR